MNKYSKEIETALAYNGVAKISWHKKATLVNTSGQNHCTSILNYNLKNKENKILFDEWVRVIIDNERKRVWIRLADIDPVKSFDKQYNALEALALKKTGYKVKFNCSQDELKQNYGVI